jgi:hypothetical protein
MVYVQPARLSSTAVWIVDLAQENSPNRNSGGTEFDLSSAGAHEATPIISTTKANKCLREFMSFK